MTLRRPSPATVIASLALAVALGGTSYAAVTITSTNIKNNTIRSRDIRNKEIAGIDIRNGTIRGKDVQDNALSGADIDEATLGSVPSAGSAKTAGTATSAKQADNAATLGGYGPGSLIRVGSDSVDADAVTGTTAQTTAATVTIVAPTRGYFAMIASSDVRNYTEHAETTCWLAVDETKVIASSRTIQLDGNGDTNEKEDCNTNVTVPVNAGSHTVDFVASPGSLTTVFDQTNLTVLFVPFGPTGAQP